MNAQAAVTKTHVLGSIHDTKAGVHWAPQLFRSKADFVRAVQQGAKDTNSMLHKFPADYDLVIVAEWDEYTGTLFHSEYKTRLGSVLDLCPLT